MEDVSDWIKPGAAVVLYNTGGAGTSRNVTTSAIAKVAAKSFTVESEATRFPIDRLAVSQGGSWGWTRHVVPADSDKALEVLAEDARQRAEARARTAVDQWLRQRTPETRRAAIVALQALEQHEGGAS